MSNWIKVSDRLPEHDTPVLVFDGANVLMSVFIKAFTEEDSWNEYDYRDYDEKNDIYYTPEGFYQRVDTYFEPNSFPRR